MGTVAAMTLVTITATGPRAAELCRALGGDRFGVRSLALPFAEVHLFFPEVRAARCTAAVLVEPHLSVPTAGRNYLTADAYLPSADTVAAVTALLGATLERGGVDRELHVEIGLPVTRDRGRDERRAATVRSLLDVLAQACTASPPDVPPGPARPRRGRRRRRGPDATRAGEEPITVDTRLLGPVTVARSAFAGSLVALERGDVDPGWLVYLPPTMAATPVSARDGLLEHPADACRAFRRDGAHLVVCEEKHMGSRAVVIVCRDGAAARRFTGATDRRGAIYSRRGIGAFASPSLEDALLDRVARAVGKTGLWQVLATDWLALDCELLPWAATAGGLLQECHLPVAAVAIAAASAEVGALDAAGAAGVDVGELSRRARARLARAERFMTTVHGHHREVDGIDDLRLAPFHVLAADGRVHAAADHRWQMTTLARLAASDPETFRPTAWRVVDVADDTDVRAATAWWDELTGQGGEGIVVKPLDPLARGSDGGLLQPALKCRGPDYLSLVFGPEYVTPTSLARLRARRLVSRRSAARREFALGVEALERHARGQPRGRVHECVAAVLALEGGRPDALL